MSWTFDNVEFKKWVASLSLSTIKVNKITIFIFSFAYYNILFWSDLTIFITFNMHRRWKSIFIIINAHRGHVTRDRKMSKSSNFVRTKTTRSTWKPAKSVKCICHVTRPFRSGSYYTIRFIIIIRTAPGPKILLIILFFMFERACLCYVPYTHNIV